MSGNTRQLELLAHSDEHFRMLTETRNLDRFADVLTISRFGYGSPILFAITRAASLPFFPSFRNEGAVYNALRSLGRPYDYTATLPIAVCHRPADERINELKWTQAALIIRMCDILLAIFEEYAAQCGPDSSCGTLLHQYLCAIGGQSPNAFADFVHYVVRRRFSALQFRLERLIATFGHLRSGWINSLQELHAALPGVHLDRIYDAGWPLVETQERLQKTIVAFGTSIAIWPQLREVMRTVLEPEEFMERLC
jgi:hypothetical protein